MKERPIIFSWEMVRAILDGQKTQTRRVITPAHLDLKIKILEGELLSPYGYPCDRLWVRETWRAEELVISGLDVIRYQADNHYRPIENNQEAADLWMAVHKEGNPWRPSIFMPRWASRITLEIINIRPERLQEISEVDAKAEGVGAWHNTIGGTIYKPEFRFLWDSINAERGYGWEANPWVWVIEFKRIMP